MKIFDWLENYFCSNQVSELKNSNNELREEVEGFKQVVEDIERGKVL